MFSVITTKAQSRSLSVNLPKPSLNARALVRWEVYLQMNLPDFSSLQLHDSALSDTSSPRLYYQIPASILKQLHVCCLNSLSHSTMLSHQSRDRLDVKKVRSPLPSQYTASANSHRLDFESAFTKWKHLSSFLLVPNRSLREDPKLNESQIRGAIETNLKVLNHVLAPFMLNGSKSLEWEKNLRAIIFAGAELGFILFSQQSTWVFDWKQQGRADSREIVVFPALLEKVLGKTRLRIVSEAVVA
jgi:hypothetical protein